MGNNESVQQNFLSRLIQVRTYEHSLIGNITIAIQPQQQTKYLLKVMNIMDSSMHRDEMSKLRARKMKNEKYVLSLNHYESVEVQELCSTSFRVFCLFQHFESDLNKLFTERSKSKKAFEEEQLTNILSQCIKSLIYIQDNGLKNSFITKEAIICSNGVFKVMDGAICRKCHPFYSLLMGEQVPEDVFLAPEILEQLKFRTNEGYFSPKADVFSLGTLMLHLACLEPLATYFDYEKCQIDYESLLLKIDKLKYSESFKSILRGMIDQNEEERYGLVTLQETLGLATRRDTFRGSRSYSLAELIKPSELTQSNRMSTKFLGACTNRTRESSEKENRSPVKRNISLLPLIQDIKEQSQLKEASIAKQTVNLIHQESIKQFKDDTAYFNSTDGLSKRYRTTESLNNSPIQMMIKARNSTNRKEEKKFGRLTLEDGQYYEGEINEGQPQGNGVMFFVNGKVCYSGNWKEGKFHGFGTVYNDKPEQLKTAFDYKDMSSLCSFWSKYEGQFFEGDREGFGTVYLTNGQKFSGCFRSNIYEGYGTFYCKNGEFINGIWSENRLRY